MAGLVHVCILGYEWQGVAARTTLSGNLLQCSRCVAFTALAGAAQGLSSTPRPRCCPPATLACAHTSALVVLAGMLPLYSPIRTCIRVAVCAHWFFKRRAKSYKYTAVPYTVTPVSVNFFIQLASWFMILWSTRPPTGHVVRGSDHRPYICTRCGCVLCTPYNSSLKATRTCFCSGRVVGA